MSDGGVTTWNGGVTMWDRGGVQVQSDCSGQPVKKWLMARPLPCSAGP